MSRHRTRAVLSQNFLRDPRLADHLVHLAGFDANDTVIEIGPGSGVLTARLARTCRQVLAIEKDANLTRKLTQRFALERAVAIFQADFLEFPLPASRYKVFANIPFSITTAIVSKLTSGVSPPEDAWLVLQREAAQRFLGEPGGTLVSALLHPWFSSQVRHHFRRTDFVPPPSVEVVLLQLSRRPEPLITRENERSFRDLVTFAYTAWQPTVEAALATALPASLCARIGREAGVDAGRPPSELKGDDWVALTRAVHAVLHDFPETIRDAGARSEAQQARLEKPGRIRIGDRGSARVRAAGRRK